MNEIFDIRKCSYFEQCKKKFLSKINKTDTCWLWTDSKPNRYNAFYFNQKYYQAHRMAYMLFNGPISPNKIVRHTCDNKRCVNPKHLILGSYSDNTFDGIKRDRGIGSPILNEEAVKVIKWMLKYKNERGLAAKLARLYKVDRHTIGNIKYGLAWKWVKI